MHACTWGKVFRPIAPVVAEWDVPQHIGHASSIQDGGFWPPQ